MFTIGVLLIVALWLIAVYCFYRWSVCHEENKILVQVNEQLESAVDHEYETAQQFLRERNFYKVEWNDELHENDRLTKELQEALQAKESLGLLLEKMDADRLTASRQAHDYLVERNFNATALETEAAEHEVTKAKLRQTEQRVEALLTLSEKLSSHLTEVEVKVIRLKEIMVTTLEDDTNELTYPVV